MDLEVEVELLVLVETVDQSISEGRLLTSPCFAEEENRVWFPAFGFRTVRFVEEMKEGRDPALEGPFEESDRELKAERPLPKFSSLSKGEIEGMTERIEREVKDLRCCAVESEVDKVGDKSSCKG